jgi:hypothetical protein
MLVSEILTETASVGATSAGSVASVAMPLGVQSRSGGSFFSGKYTTDPTPNTARKKELKNARRKT